MIISKKGNVIWLGVTSEEAKHFYNLTKNQALLSGMLMNETHTTPQFDDLKRNYDKMQELSNAILPIISDNGN